MMSSMKADLRAKIRDHTIQNSNVWTGNGSFLLRKRKAADPIFKIYIYSNLWKVTFGLGVNLKISTGLSFAFALIFWHQSLEAT